jgi:SAM-dependent methyltransferase
MNASGEIFDFEQYRTRCGDKPNLRTTPEFQAFFRSVADAIILGLAPRKVFDAGCAMGFLVEILWECGVEAHGRDISDFAISQVRADVRPWCEVGSIADPIEGDYDLVLCIGVLENMPNEEALAAIRNMAAAAPRILFSSSPIDLKAITHVNVRPTRYWLERFAEVGFAPVVRFDATFVCPHAMLLERSDEGRDNRSLMAFAEIVRQRLMVAEVRQNETMTRMALQREVAVARQAETELQQEVTTARQVEAELQQEIAAARQAEAQSRAELQERIAALRLGESEARAAAQRAEAAESRLRAMEQSRAWRIVPTLPRTSDRLPLMQRKAGLAWWTFAKQLPRRAWNQRQAIAAISIFRQTGLFDDDYYKKNNPHIEATGMDPALHFVRYGWKEGRKPSPAFDPAFYLDQYPDVAATGINPLLHYVRYGRSEGRQPLLMKSPALGSRPEVPSVRSMLQAHCAPWAPLPVFADRGATPTMTIVADSVDANHLLGGVDTALVIGTLLARRMDARLRLVTRHNAPDPGALGDILQAHRVEWNGAVDFVHVPAGGDRPLSLGDQDIILTTSWTSTRAVLGSVSATRVLCLLEEDERMFYPYGDDHRLRCTETLAESALRVLVNTRLLFDFLADGPDPLPHLRERGHWFEPAFPAFRRSEAGPPQEGKRNFFFYARPDNDQNLYWRGLEVIEAAMREGVLAPSEWIIHFIGDELADIELPGGVHPIVLAKLPYSKYAELVSRMDLGLCLMDTPHLSYSALDLASSGAVVITKTHGPKTSLEQWSRNIIAAPPSVAALVDALRRGVLLARDAHQREMNCAADHIPRDWEAQLKPTFDWLLAGRG